MEAIVNLLDDLVGNEASMKLEGVQENDDYNLEEGRT
jgi:hypothetical protein